MPLRNGNTFRDGNENNLLYSRFGLKFWGNRSAGRRAGGNFLHPGSRFYVFGIRRVRALPGYSGAGCRRESLDDFLGPAADSLFRRCLREI